MIEFCAACQHAPRMKNNMLCEPCSTVDSKRWEKESELAYIQCIVDDGRLQEALTLLLEYVRKHI